ncbi:MAG: HD domain-containing phosphohydrolase [Gemmatimonadota bacterium]
MGTPFIAATSGVGQLPGSVEEASAFFDRLLARLKATLASPGANAPEVFRDAYDAIHAVPPGLVTAAGVECLLMVVHYAYISAMTPQGIGPAADAIAAARLVGDKSLLRKALTFGGVLQMETGNLPVATELFAEALDLARELRDQFAESVLWNNLGLALQYAAHYADAIRCYERSIAIAGADPAMRLSKGSALSNVAYASLNIQDLGRGLRAVRQAVEVFSNPANATDCMYRTLAENHFAQLLLETGDVEGAKKRCEYAKEFAAKSGMERAELAAAVAEGLTEVQAGTADVGLTRLKRSLEKARSSVRGFLRDAMSAAVKGYEIAGQPDVALVYLHELLKLNQDAKQQQVLMHHQRHLEQVEQAYVSVVDNASADASLNKHLGDLRIQLGERELMKSRVAMLEQQSVAAELHDDTTGEHCYRVGRFASILGKEYGLEEDVCFMIDLAARMHDIGKLAVPDSILLKPGRLTDGERKIMQQHTIAGAEILARSNIPQMHIAEEIARHHHEWWNGRGYPFGLAGTAIPVAARITAIVDVFDALTHVRPYKHAWPVAEAMQEIWSLRGMQFDPEVTDLFMELVPRLQREVGDLDVFLGAEAKHSPFIQARARIAAALKGPDGRGMFDLRR